MRLFIAINLPPAEREAIHRAAAPLRAAGLPVRWLPARSLHLTLKFLGEVRAEDGERMARAMAEAAAGTPPFDLRIGGAGAFPARRAPRVLWVGVEPTPPLRSLKDGLERRFAELGFAPEERAFQPHVTLGRTAREARPGDFGGLDALFGRMAYRGVIRIREIDLMRSHLSGAGAAYERIASAPLG